MANYLSGTLSVYPITTEGLLIQPPKSFNTMDGELPRNKRGHMLIL